MAIFVSFTVVQKMSNYGAVMTATSGHVCHLPPEPNSKPGYDNCYDVLYHFMQIYCCNGRNIQIPSGSPHYNVAFVQLSEFAHL